VRDIGDFFNGDFPAVLGTDAHFFNPGQTVSFFVRITNHDLDIIAVSLNAQRFFTVKCLANLTGKVPHGHADGAGTLLYPNFFLLFAGFEIIGNIKGPWVGCNFSHQLAGGLLELFKILAAELDLDRVAGRTAFQSGKGKPFNSRDLTDQFSPFAKNGVG